MTKRTENYRTKLRSQQESYVSIDRKSPGQPKVTEGIEKLPGKGTESDPERTANSRPTQVQGKTRLDIRESIVDHAYTTTTIVRRHIDTLRTLDRSDEIDTSDRSDRSDRSDISDISDISDRSDISERPDRSDRSHRSDRSDRCDRYDRSDRLDRSDR